jgi:hypothetical protein
MERSQSAFPAGDQLVDQGNKGPLIAGGEGLRASHAVERNGHRGSHLPVDRQESTEQLAR